MDAALVIDGAVVQVWRDTQTADLPAPSVGALLQFPPGEAVCGMTWDGISLGLKPKTLDDLKAAKLAEIEAEYERRLAAGYPVTFEGNAETLQVARDVDRTNWLTMLGICDEARGAGFGSELMAEPGFQCTSNRRYRVTWDEAAGVIRALRQWNIDAWANWNRLKDLVRDAASRDEVYRIDLEEGWP